MKKLYISAFIGLTISLTATVAHAEWRKLPPASDGTTQYYEPGSIERSGTIVRLTWLNDSPSPRYVRIRKSSKTWSSQIFQAEYNCTKHEYRIVTNTLYSGQMASGESFASSSTGQWRDTSDGYEMWRTTFGIACSAK